MEYPLGIIKKRLIAGDLSGLLVTSDSVIHVLTPESKPRFVGWIQKTWVILFLSVFVFLLFQLYIFPARTVRQAESETLDIIRTIDSNLVSGNLTSALNTLGIFDWHITAFADGVIVLSIQEPVNLFSLAQVLEPVRGVLGYQHSLDGVQIKVLRGAL
jgi:hypothetical protein